MGDQNKILDVTYGKFSCRLEGFDDAVGTMKAVVSYFHDLAGDENFLEVAPGIPDVNTLAEMAKEQDDDLIEVRSDADGVTLSRIVEPVAAPETDAAYDDVAPIEDVAVEPETDDVVADATREDTSADDAAAMTEAAADDADLEPEEVLLLSPDAETADTEEPVVLDDIATTQVAAEGAHELESSEVDTEETLEQEIVEEATDTEETPEPADALETDFAAEQLDAPAEDTESDEDLAARLDRIRSAVSRVPEPQPAPEEEPLVEPAPAAPAAKRSNPLAQRLAQLAKRNSELMDADARLEAPALPDAAAESEADPVEPMQDVGVDEAHMDEVEEVPSTDTPTIDGAEDIPVAQTDTVAAVDQVTGPEAENDDAIAAADPVADSSDAIAQSDAEETMAEPVEEAAEAEAELDDATAETPSVAEDTSDAAEDGDKEKTREATRPLLLTTPQRPAGVEAADETNEDDDDDFDLTAELAEVEKEIAARPRNEMTKHGLPRRVEDAMSRIFSETNHQLDAPEGRRNRDALAQLKAAVAATEAAKQLGDSAKSRDAGAAFRDDLGALDEENRAKPDGLPPLKLVTTTDEEAPKEKVLSDDRVTSKPLDAAADRLRQIAAKKEPSAGGMNFTSFLERHGVTELADKLEAAAAYLAFVEGEPDFTRPQLMRLVQSASTDEITREDGLRCFGRLLRQARFAKLNNGRFKVDDNTPFRPRTSRMAQG